MASGEVNELDKDIRSTGNDDSEKIERAELGLDSQDSRFDRDRTQENIDKKKEVSLADIIDNPDKFPNMLNIMATMNKFPIDGGTVAKYLGEQFRQPVSPDRADKQLATVLLRMFRKISNDLNGFVLFDNGEIDDEASLKQAMKEGIPVPPGVNKETFEDKFRTTMEIIRKDAEIFDVKKFVDDYIEGNKSKYANIMHKDELENKHLLMDLSILANLDKFYTNENSKSYKDYKNIFDDDKLDAYADMVIGKQVDEEGKKSTDRTAEELYRSALIKFGEIQKTGKLPGKSEEEQLSNAILIISAVELSAFHPQFVEDAKATIAQLVSELTKGVIEPNGESKFLLDDMIYYKDHDRKTLQYKAAGKHKSISEEDKKESIKSAIGEVTKKNDFGAATRLFLELEVVKQGRLDPSVVIEKQKALLEKYKISEDIDGLYENGAGSELSGMGSMLIYKMRTDIMKMGMERDIEAIKKRLETEPETITPEQRKFYAKVLFGRISVAFEDNRYARFSYISDRRPSTKKRKVRRSM